MFDGSTENEVRLVQPTIASSPIVVTDKGIVMEDSVVHIWNACEPIVVTEIGIVTEVRVVQ